MLIIPIILSNISLIWELWNDRNGDSHISRGPIKILSKTIDILVRFLLVFLISLINFALFSFPLYKTWIIAFICHNLIFDYGIAYILIKRKVIKGYWFTYMGSNETDEYYKKLTPIKRLILKLLIFVAGLLVCIFL